MSQRTREQIKAFFETGDTPTQSQFGDLIDSAAWYDELPDELTEYVALLTQASNDAPVATVLKNTLGATISYSFDGTGRYVATASAGVFTANKTVIEMGPGWNTGDGSLPAHISALRNSTTEIAIRTFQTLDPIDGILAGTVFKITVYP